jgi:hypothetical protein
MPIVPPGGFAGFSQMTPASRVALSRGTRTSGPRRRRASNRAAPKRRRSSARKRNGRKMKFGSPAWQKKYKVGKYRR